MVRKFLFIIITVILILTVLYLYKKFKGHVYVKSQVVTRQELLVTVTSTSTGTVKTGNEVRITAERAGTIKTLYIEEGDIVKTGTLLAQFDSEEVLLNKKRIEAKLNSRKRQLIENKRLLRSLKIEVESKIAEAKAILNEAKTRHKRYKKLLEKGYIPEMTYDEVKKQLEVAQTVYKAALSGREKVKAMEEELIMLKELVKETKAELELMKLDYNRSFIKSPIDGVITSRPVKVGDTLMKGNAVATVVNTEELFIEAPIDEADIAKVELGQDVRVIMDAYPDKVFSGKVESISPVVLGKRLEARTFKVKVVFVKKPPTLKIGMSSDIEIIIGKIDNSLIVPTQSILERNGKKLIYLIDGDNARVKEVKTGLFNWSFTEIRDGLREGDVIIINPDVPGLKDGAKIKGI